MYFFNNLKDKSPQIGLMHDLYEYTLIECSFFHIYNCTCYTNMYAEVVSLSVKRVYKISRKKYFPLSRFF
jgi:hypothetical protein